MASKSSVATDHLEECIAKTQEFLKVWVQFERMIRDAHHKINLTPDMEKRYLQLKCNCARAHEYLSGLLGDSYIGKERITTILRRCVTLNQLSKTRDENYFNIQNDWQVQYLHLQETLQSLQYQHEKIQ